MLDGGDEIRYNDTNNDANEIVVKMDDQAPLNDIECKHETLVADPDDTIGDAVYHGCSNHKCGVGYYIRK
jgi:hypothetical protein